MSDSFFKNLVANDFKKEFRRVYIANMKIGRIQNGMYSMLLVLDGLSQEEKKDIWSYWLKYNLKMVDTYGEAFLRQDLEQIKLIDGEIKEQVRIRKYL